MYEVTDRLTYYVCSRKPNHRLDEHIIIPECTLLLEQIDLCLEGRNRLQLVSTPPSWKYKNIISGSLLFSYQIIYWKS